MHNGSITGIVRKGKQWHGRVGSKKEVREFLAFLEKCIEMVSGAIRQGISKEEAVNSISFEEFLTPVHPGPEQQRRNVGRLYEMLVEPPGS